MPVIAMQVVDKQAHERTDKLFIYQFESPEQGRLQIVANTTNVYDVGDVAGVALVGTWLPDGEIAERKVFGHPSFGMACGPVQAAVDTDVSDQFDADPPKRTFRFTITVEAEGFFAADAKKAAGKLVKGGKCTWSDGEAA